MSNLVLAELTETRALSKELSVSKLLPLALQNKAPDVLAIVLAGRELGLGPMQAIRGIDIIAGKVAMSSALIGALIMSSPECEYLTPIEFTDKVATYETKRKGSPNPVRMSFTFEEAKQAGLTGKDNYRKNPVAMLLARCQARIGRAVYPDKCLGVYDRDSGELDQVREKDVTPAAQESHVEGIKAGLMEARKPAITDAEVVPESMAERIAACQTTEELEALVPEIKKLSDEERKALHAVYAAKKGQF